MILGHNNPQVQHAVTQAVVTQSVVTEDDNTTGALERMGVSKEKIHLIPSGVDVEKAVRRELEKGTGKLKTAKISGCGVSVVQISPYSSQ